MKAVEVGQVPHSCWTADAIAETVWRAESFAIDRAVTEPQRELLRAAFAGLRRQIESCEFAVEQVTPYRPPFVCVPLLVYAGIHREHGPAVPLAAATTMLFLGLDILDDAADGDRVPAWQGRSEWEMNLVGSTLLSSLWQLAILQMSATPEVITDVQRIGAESLLRMAAGQQGDLGFCGTDHVSAREVEASVALKSGEEVAMFARMAARFGGASPEQTEAYAEFGRSLGTAGQLASDCYELFCDPKARDLAHGARTLPIALHMEKLPSTEHARFCSLLQSARDDEPAREQVRRQLALAGVLWRCTFVIETYCQRALRFLSLAGPLEPAGAQLRALVDAVSFFPAHIANRPERCGVEYGSSNR